MGKTEELGEWAEKLRNSGKTVVVEGIKDKRALEKLGIKNIFPINCKPLYKATEEIACKGKDCIILTDLDKEGRKIYGKLNSGLQRMGIRVDNYFREFLLKKTKLRQVEGMSSYLGRE